MTNITPTVRQQPGSPFKDRHGTYNPTSPLGIGYVDLNYVRDIILDKSLNTLSRRDSGVRVNTTQPYKGRQKLNLEISGPSVERLTEKSGMIDPSVLEYFKRR